MLRLGWAVTILIVTSGCASGSREPATPLAWEPGRYLLEASITYETVGRDQVDRHSAELVIEPGGEIELTSTQGGLCLDPAAVALGADAARGRRTFVCSNVSRYELRPVSGSVSGEMFAEVTEERVVTQCVRYTTTAEGQQVCAETVERLVTNRVMKRARLKVTPVR